MLMYSKPDMKAPGPSSNCEYPVVCYHNFSIGREGVIKGKITVDAKQPGKRHGHKMRLQWRYNQMGLKPHRRGLQTDLVNSAEFCLNVSSKGSPRGVVWEKRRGERMFGPSIQ